MTWLLSGSMIPCPTHLISNLQIVCGHSPFSKGIYRSCINYLLWIVWCAARTNLGYLNNLLRCHCYRTPYTSHQSISHIILPYPGIKGQLYNITTTSTSCLLGGNAPSCCSVLHPMCGMSPGKVTNTYTSTNDKCAYWRTMANFGS